MMRVIKLANDIGPLLGTSKNWSAFLAESLVACETL